MDQPETIETETVIATRKMKRKLPDGTEAIALVEIGAPFPHPKKSEQVEGDWCCRVRTQGLGNDVSFVLFGMDAIQALYHALAIAGTLTTTSPYAAALDWANIPNHGFPPLLLAPKPYKNPTEGAV